jgi:hypothetical protein
MQRTAAMPAMQQCLAALRKALSSAKPVSVVSTARLLKAPGFWEKLGPDINNDCFYYL